MTWSCRSRAIRARSRDVSRRRRSSLARTISMATLAWPAKANAMSRSASVNGGAPSRRDCQHTERLRAAVERDGNGGTGPGLPVDRCLVGLTHDARRTLTGKRPRRERAGSREDAVLDGRCTRTAGGRHAELVVAVRHRHYHQIHIDQRSDALRDDLEHILARHFEHGCHHVGGGDAPDLPCLRQVVQACVLDRDSGGRGERDDQLLVIGAERTPRPASDTGCRRPDLRRVPEHREMRPSEDDCLENRRNEGLRRGAQAGSAPDR